MTREDPLIRVRLPEPLKAQIQAAATGARRSMNAEIVSRLEASFALVAVAGPDDLSAQVKALRDDLTALRRELDTVGLQVRHLENVRSA